MTACSGIGFPKPGAARVPAFQNFEHLFTHTSDGFALLAKIPTEPGRPPSCRSWSSPPRVRRNPPPIQPQAALHRNPRRTGCVAGLGAPSCLFRRIRSLAAVSFRDQTLRDKWPRSRFHEQENDSRLAEGNRKKPRPCFSMRQPSLENTNAPGSNPSSQRAAEKAPRLALDSTSARQKRRTSFVFCTDFPSWSPSSVGRRSTRWPNSCNRARICACIESP